MKARMTHVYRLADGAPMPFHMENGHALVDMPRPIFDPMATVIVVETDGN